MMGSHITVLLHHFELTLRRYLGQELLLILAGSLVLLSNIELIAPGCAVNLELLVHFPRAEAKLIIDRSLRLVLLSPVVKLPDSHASKLACVVRRVYRFVLDPDFSIGRR